MVRKCLWRWQSNFFYNLLFSFCFFLLRQFFLSIVTIFISVVNLVLFWFMFRAKIFLIFIVFFSFFAFEVACLYFYIWYFFFCFWIIWPLSHGLIISDVSFRRWSLMLYLWMKLIINLFSCWASEEPFFITCCSFYLWWLPNSFFTKFISFSSCPGSLCDSFLFFDWLLLRYLFSVDLCFLLRRLSFLLS